jgi:ADP-ribose pyrophosphatase YjhB (NUDIX family)
MSIPEFGIQRENEERRDGGCAVVYDPKSHMFAVGVHDEGELLRLFSGGVEEGEDMEEGTLREVTEESGLHDFAKTIPLGTAIAHYHNVLKDVNRVAYVTGYLVILRSRDTQPTELEDHEKFSLTWRTADDIYENWKARSENHNYDHWIYFLEKSLEKLEEIGYIL